MARYRSLGGKRSALSTAFFIRNSVRRVSPPRFDISVARRRYAIANPLSSAIASCMLRVKRAISSSLNARFPSVYFSSAGSDAVVTRSSGGLSRTSFSDSPILPRNFLLSAPSVAISCDGESAVS